MLCGGDHNVAFAKVVASYYFLVLLGMKDGMVTLMAIRTVGGQSWINPVEGVMATLNFGLYGLPLIRDAAEHGWEKLFAKKTTKA